MEHTTYGAQSEASPAVVTLQSLIWPETGVCTERDLYIRTHGAVALSVAERELRFLAAGEASFGTWFNLFDANKWQRECDLQSLVLHMTGCGEFEISVFVAGYETSWDRVVSECFSLSDDKALNMDLSTLLCSGLLNGRVFVQVLALGPGKLCDVCWQTYDKPRRSPKLRLAVTTFRREEEVARTIERFARFRATTPLADHISLMITDNGQSLAVSDLPEGVEIAPNENLGGAGGFTRGLLEARAAGASHCLFMDDDASIHMQSLERTWMFLAYAMDTRTAVAGAMINDRHRWAIWENGALFFTRCIPRFMGTDLRDPLSVMEMEGEASLPVPWNFYAGWWYFAFPVDVAEHLAFPFFVRGDDVSFSLANDFNIVTLNGVTSFQESFTDKESPQTWYLDLRSHLAHHLSLPKLDVGALGVVKIALIFFLRNLPRMHYDTLAAINLAIEDVLKGPEFFDEHADMAQRRADLKALTQTEAWLDITPEMDLPAVRTEPLPAWRRHLMKPVLNGLLLPFYGRWGRRVTLRAKDRGHIGFYWDAAEIVVLNATGTRMYVVRHDKRAALREVGKFLRNAWALRGGYSQLKERFHAQYPKMTSEDYWRQKLGMSDRAHSSKEDLVKSGEAAE
jgi:GT2 family glycosyltransferase